MQIILLRDKDNFPSAHWLDVKLVQAMLAESFCLAKNYSGIFGFQSRPQSEFVALPRVHSAI